MPDPARAIQEFGTVVVIGGGCYGAYYVRQLQRAVAAGVVRIESLVVVDRDPACRVVQAGVGPAGGQPRPRVVTGEWGEFLAAYLAAAAEDPARVARDAIVPSPLMPHLLAQWMTNRVIARWSDRDVRTAPLEAPLPVPWQRAGEDGTHYASFATWMCPINCIEPARCPHTRGPRDWTMPVALERHVAATAEAGQPIAGPYTFHCTHRAYGVGMIDVGAVVAAEADLARRVAEGPVDAIIGTVSHCHGAVTRLRVDGKP